MTGGVLLALLPNNGLDLTAIVLAVIGLIGSYVMPKMVTRQAARKALEDASDVSWVEINKTLRVENLQVKAELAASQAEVARLNAEIYRLHGQPPNS